MFIRFQLWYVQCLECSEERCHHSDMRRWNSSDVMNITTSKLDDAEETITFIYSAILRSRADSPRSHVTPHE